MDVDIRYYEIHKLADLSFKFKLDKNPLNKNYEPHIWHRHLIAPEQASLAWLNKSEEIWNPKHQRYECYSQKEIMIITAFKM
jgi:hypothetical protein